MSGYDKQKDYGGPTPTWWGSALLIMAIIASATLAMMYAGV
ncbi:hypothetical protein [Ahrensia sp. 13_GOM-1096m]|nr:hypothetical protein [Ahrensia sp. 13_GOM-1096m]